MTHQPGAPCRGIGEQQLRGVHGSTVLRVRRVPPSRRSALRGIRRRRIPARPYTSFTRFTGNSRTRFPVAAKIALHSAGAIGGTPGSPVPTGIASEATK